MIAADRRSFARVALAGFALAALLCAGAALVFSSPDLFRQVSAWRLSAHYLGVDGVELQTKHNACGLASLKMVLDHFGLPVALRELEEQLVLTRRGTSMLALKGAAQRWGLHADGWRLLRDDLLRVSLPVIILVHGDHFVVVDSICVQRWVYMRDPSIGRLRMPLNHLAQMWRGETLVFARKTDGESQREIRQTPACWCARDNQTQRNPQSIPRSVLQKDVAGGWDAVGRVTNKP